MKVLLRCRGINQKDIYLQTKYLIFQGVASKCKALK